MEENKQTVICSSYTEAQKRATKKYRDNNKEKVNEQRKKYYLKRKEKDPGFLEYKRLKAREYYQKKKALRNLLKQEKEDKILAEIVPKTELSQAIEKVIQDVSQLEITEQPLLDETVVEKKKRKHKNKK